MTSGRGDEGRRSSSSLPSWGGTDRRQPVRVGNRPPAPANGDEQTVPHPVDAAHRLSLPTRGREGREEGFRPNATDARLKRASAFAQALTARSSLTPQEARVWGFLKTLRPQGFHFRRQAPFRGYRLDFVCFSRRLVIEIDGTPHGAEAQQAHDTLRDTVLAREGFRTLRIWNRDVNMDMHGVATMIRDTLRLPTLTASRYVPPHEGREEA